jgi:tRNA-dihydrouridine synthase B
MASFAEILSGLHGGKLAACLAPMAGVSDLSLRRSAHYFGASYVVSEMIDSRFYAARDGESQTKAQGAGLAGHVVQIAGCRPDLIAEAARQAEAQGAEAVDINMGCPAKSVVGGMGGSALMRDLDHATSIVRAARAAISVPLTLKMRLGWDDATRNAAELARRAEGEGVALVTVHGRTRCQFYKGQADWTAIRAVVSAVRIPVVANGDCTSLSDARAMLTASGAAGVMIGRGAIGRPWLVGDIAHALATGRSRALPSTMARRDCAIAQYHELLSLHGRERGIRHARKHLAGYATHAGFPAGTPQHQALVTETDPNRVVDHLTRIFDTRMFDDTPLRAAA